MRKTFIAYITCLVFSLSNGIYAEPTVNAQENSDFSSEGNLIQNSPQSDEEQLQQEPMPQAKQVGKATSEEASAAKKTDWGSIIIAAGTVTIATIALILVSRDHHHHHHHHH
jgi:hypothetical protein